MQQNDLSRCVVQVELAGIDLRLGRGPKVDMTRQSGK